MSLKFLKREESVTVEWTISNWKDITAVGKKVVSPIFGLALPNTHQTWFMECWPYGKESCDAGYVSLSINVDEVVVSQCNVNMYCGGVSQYSSSVSVNTNVKVISRTIHRNNLGHSSYNILRIALNVVISNDCSQLTHLKESQSKQLMLEFEQLFKNKDLSDIDIVVRNGSKISAHKCILSARSPVFKAMFHSGLKESRENTVLIDDLEEEVVRDMISFMYFGSCPNLGTLAVDLVGAAEKYGLGGLKDLCEYQLILNLTVDKFCSYFSLAHLYNLNKLKAACLKFIPDKLGEVLVSPVFDEIFLPKPELLKEVLSQCASVNGRA